MPESSPTRRTPMTPHPTFMSDSRFLSKDFAFGGDSSRILGFVERHLRTLPSPTTVRIADMGCGTAAHTLRMADGLPGNVVRGFEPAPDLYSRALENQRAAKNRNLIVENLDAGTVASLFPCHFDLVVANLVGCFSGGLDRFARSISESLAPGGFHITCEFFFPEFGDSKERIATEAYFREGYRFTDLPRIPSELVETYRRAGVEPVGYAHEPVIRIEGAVKGDDDRRTEPRHRMQRRIERRYFLEEGFFDRHRFVKFFVFRRT